MRWVRIECILVKNHLASSTLHILKSYSPLGEMQMTRPSAFSIYLSSNILQIGTASQLSHLSLTFLSLHRAGPAGQYLVIQYFRYCAMYSASWYFFMSPCMLPLHLFFGRPLFLLPETSSRSDFAHMWLGSRLKQWPNHFSLLFSRKVSTGFTWASFRCLHF